MNTTKVTFKTAAVNGFKIFYREAGDPQKPTVLLLHGFPTSSHMFRNLIPQLQDDFHIIAPDLPGFGFSDAPGHDVFQYTFANVAKVMGDFVEQLGLKKFAIYIFDYGAPTGLRMALRFPERISAIITQNGNAYVDGLSKDWAPVQTYWENPTRENREALRKLQTLDTTRWQYYHGVTNPEEKIAPEAILLDQTLLDRPQSDEIQLDLIGDYKTNVELYPKFQEFFRKYLPPTLAVWGKNDPFFIPPGAEAYKRDNPKTKVVFYDTGHFALETHATEIGQEILNFLKANL